MHLMKDVLRLHHECGRSQREVARSCGVSVGTVNGLLRKAREAGLGWPLPADLYEQQLHERLYGAVPGSQQRPRRETIDFAAMHKELQRRKHLTVQLLWHPYREECPDGYSYSQYCELYRAWKACLGLDCPRVGGSLLSCSLAASHLPTAAPRRPVPSPAAVDGH